MHFMKQLKCVLTFLRACQPVVEDSSKHNMNISLPIIESESADNTDSCAVVNTCFRWALMNFTVKERFLSSIESDGPIGHRGGSWSNDIMV